VGIEGYRLHMHILRKLVKVNTDRNKTRILGIVGR
jgi:hypothetical protein